MAKVTYSFFVIAQLCLVASSNLVLPFGLPPLPMVIAVVLRQTPWCEECGLDENKSVGMKWGELMKPKILPVIGWVVALHLSVGEVSTSRLDG